MTETASKSSCDAVSHGIFTSPLILRDEQVRASVAVEHLGEGRFVDHMRRYEVCFTRQLERTSRHLAAVQERRAHQIKRNQPDTKNLQKELEPAA